VGKAVGPDLAGLRSKAPQVLLEAILDPNRAVEDKFIAYSATTQDGRSMTGLVQVESGNSITLAAADGQVHTLLRDEIEEFMTTGRSLMPEGFEKAIPPERMADLASVRLTLETSIAALAAQHRRPEHLRELERLQQILHQPRKSLAAHVKADGEFHATLAEAAGNPFFSLVLAPIHDLLTESRLQTLRRFGASIAWQHHQRILDAVRARDADEAARAMEEHLTVNSRHLSEIDEEVETETPPPVEPSTHRRKAAGKHVPR
jgi:putative heme-binding domain-containing protein